MTNGFANWAIKRFELSEFHKNHVVPRQIKALMRKPISDFHPRGSPYLENKLATNILERSFHSKFGGLQVLCAPSGSGKTTYLRKYANEFIRRGGHVQYYASELKSSNDFFASFGDEDRSQDLFSKLPLNSAIIIDQFDRCGDTVNNDLSRLLRHLALESRRTDGNIVIVSTSSLGNAETVLKLNGNNKINLAGPPLWFKWTEDMTNTYIDKAFPHWCESDR
eukprot:gene5863-gene6471